MSEQVFHVGIKALVTNESKEVLMLHEKFDDGAEQWDIPGGRMDPGETFLQTLKRELAEEIGVDGYESAEQIATVLSNKKIRNSDGEFGLILVVFSVSLADDSEPKPMEPDVTLTWESLDQAKKLLADKYPSEFCEKLSIS